MKIQIDFPDNMDKALKFYMINNDYKTKADAVVELAIKQLKPMQDTFIKECPNETTKITNLVDRD